MVTRLFRIEKRVRKLQQRQRGGRSERAENGVSSGEGQPTRITQQPAKTALDRESMSNDWPDDNGYPSNG